MLSDLAIISIRNKLIDDCGSFIEYKQVSERKGITATEVAWNQLSFEQKKPVIGLLSVVKLGVVGFFVTQYYNKLCTTIRQVVKRRQLQAFDI